LTADSVKAQLKRAADTEGKDFNYILMHYFIERLLYRLSVSPYAENFVLKGGLLLYAVMEQRVTRDIDFLVWHIENLPGEMVRIFKEITAIPGDDAVSFDTEAVIGELIKALQEKGLTQKQLEELSGIRQPVIARMEKGNNPQLDTVLKVLAPLGKRLAVPPNGRETLSPAGSKGSAGRLSRSSRRLPIN
jgi:hypothetical protein